jgi:hypothetical protein
MTDHPRFEQVKGEHDVAHEAYYGGSVVSLVFRLVDRWKGGPRKMQRTVGSAAGAVEIHERPTAMARSRPLPDGADTAALEQTVHRTSPEESFSDSFLMGSARTMQLQAGLLAAIAAVLIILVAQGLGLPESPHGQVVRDSPPGRKHVTVKSDDGSPKGRSGSVRPAHFTP